MNYSEMERQLIGAGLVKTAEEKLDQAFKTMPTNQIINCTLAIHNTILPKVVESRGANHPDTKLFEEVRDCLMYALHAVEKAQELGVNFYNLRILNDTLFQRCRLLEKQLDKFQALEEMEIQSTLDDYRQIARERLKTLLLK
jgi:hypothetical protein